MAQYLILIYEDESAYAGADAQQWGDISRAHTRYAEQIGELGAKMIGGNGLEPVATATSVRRDVVTDGPFVETKESLGGYYLIEANDLDHALSVAKLCPIRAGGVEVRPVMDTTGR